MPNNPLPTPTPPAAAGGPNRSQPLTGVVNQGAAPRLQATLPPTQTAVSPNQPAVSPTVPPKVAAPTPAAVVKPAVVAAPPRSTTVAPGQLRPPSVPAAPQAPSAPGSLPSLTPVQPRNTSPVGASGAPIAAARPVTTAPANIQPNRPTPVASAQPRAVSSPASPAAVQPVARVAPAVVSSSAPKSVAPTPVARAAGVTPAPSAVGLPKPGQPLPTTPVGATVSAPVTGTTSVPGTTPSGSQPLKPATAVKKPPALLFAIIAIVLVAILGVVGFSIFSPKKTAQSGTGTGQTGNTTTGGKTTGSTTKTAAGKQTTITYWGLWEPTEVLAEVIKDFETANPQYKIDYRKQSHRDYRERLQTAIASGNGPDIFRFHASWTPMLQDELAVLPSSVMSDAEYRKTFYPIAAKQLAIKGKLVGIPLMYDGLALYYNVDILKTANAEPPQTWAELRTLADALTVPSNKSARSTAPLQRAGLAIGNADNVEHFADILGLLILQNGGDFTKPNSPEVRDALLFYTNFIKEDGVWSSALPSSTVAFARGDVAMMIAPSWRAHDIKNLNPKLNFAVAPAPKLGDTRLGWASYWAEGVNSKSKNQEGAWAFLKYLSSAEVLRKLYASASTVRSFGEIYPRQDMAKDLSDDPITSQFLVDAPTADSWYLNSFTHDNGLNDQLIKYYADAINGVLAGKTVDEALQTVEAGTTQVMRQYNAQ